MVGYPSKCVTSVVSEGIIIIIIITYIFGSGSVQKQICRRKSADLKQEADKYKNV